MTDSIACVVGARPNFVKIGPVLAGLRAVMPEMRPVLVHTGQHYDKQMSDLFFTELGLPQPDVSLKVGSGTHGQQTARILERYEAWLTEVQPRPWATLVVGDVNSTIACALASSKLGIPVIHVEAGLRSFDRRMPEEINRVVTDVLSDLLLASEPAGVENLRREGRPETAIRLVGNVMIDVLLAQVEAARRLGEPQRLGLTPRQYGLVTLHRPSNVDDPAHLGRLCGALARIAKELPIAFPVHPRTRARIEAAGLLSDLLASQGLVLTEPLGYREFLSLSSQAALVVTDSGGLQEETTALGIPCLTMRDTTDRPVTVTEGTSTLLGHDVDRLEILVKQVIAGTYKQGRCPELWDGKAGPRIAQSIAEFYARVH
ncbi:MAG: UDP-N-acetylglucosamine 2-epimerase (non-hydrolyzing) [Pirellulales bacterium]|nr:UDP-N-acetylglucosamine 2-epimerase (non-hydrolyzing) [Pirellulales bacterium]